MALPSFALATPPANEGPGLLPELCIDKAKVSVSGVSSGGFLAHQLHLALSQSIVGAGIFAAGPYACAGTGYPATLARALGVCSNFLPSPLPFFGPPDARRSINAAQAAADAGRIDSLHGLSGDRVLLFSGRRDVLVPTSVMQSVVQVYDAFGAAAGLSFVDNVDAAHAMITASFGNACEAVAAPFVNACGFDLAGATLQHIYGPLVSPVAANGHLVAFDQRSFVEPGRPLALAESGFLYLPDTCTDRPGCRLHIALHGCGQTAAMVGDTFYRHAGYNGWAEANRIAVLYPQAAVATTRILGIDMPWPNPQGCWDWWGFTGDDYATRNGVQINAIAAMIDRLAGSPTISGSSAPGSSCAVTGGA